jgi:DNA-binding beta-propeller fold protein YncE
VRVPIRSAHPALPRTNQCYSYVTASDTHSGDLLVGGPGPSPGRPQIWTNEALRDEPFGWRTYTVATTIALVLILVVFLALLGFVSAISVSRNESIGGPNWSKPPSAYGLNAVMSRDGKRLFVTEPGYDRLAVVSIETGRVLATVPTGPTPTGLALSPNGDQVWVANSFQNPISSSPSASGLLGNVTVISTVTYKVLGTVETQGVGALDVAFSPNGRDAYLTANGIPGEFEADAGVQVIDTKTFKAIGALTPLAATLKVVGRLTPESSQQDSWFPASVAVSPNGRQVWVSSQSVQSPSLPGYIYVFSAATDTELESIEVGEGSFFMALSPDGKDAYVADKESCDIQEINTSTFRDVAIVRTPVKHGCPYGIAATMTDGVVDTVTGSDHTLGLGHQGDVFAQVDLNTSSETVLHGVGADPLTITDASNGLGYVIDADSPIVTVINTHDDVVVGQLDLTAVSQGH